VITVLLDHRSIKHRAYDIDDPIHGLLVSRGARQCGTDCNGAALEDQEHSNRRFSPLQQSRPRRHLDVGERVPSLQ
jgi:hypothetical protein